MESIIEKYLKKLDCGTLQSTFKDLLLEDSTTVVAAVLVELILQDPGLSFAKLKELRMVLQKKHPHLYPQVQVVKIDPNIQQGAVLLAFTVGDSICLEGRNEATASSLRSMGKWWRVISGISPNINTGRPAQWHLQSLPRREQGIKIGSSAVSHTLNINKENDPGFRVIHVCPAVKKFNYKDYE